MNKILGIIAEYNPFHNGHLYHLNMSKTLTSATHTIAIISGNFTQRGSTSLIDKWVKTESALRNGIDLVIELPVLYSVSSAENFADGAIKILNSLGVVDNISFGIETDKIEELDKIASILYNEPKDYKTLLSKELSHGISYPRARENALNKYLNISSNILNSPNNILGIEYLKALKKYNSSVVPIGIKRHKSNYNDIEYSNNIASATAIRELIKNKNYKQLKNLLPKPSYSLLMENKKNIVLDLNNFEKEILYILRRMSIEEIKKLADVSEGLEHLIKKAVYSYNSISDVLNMVKSKRYTSTRIQRIFLYSLLGITKEDIELSKNVTPYIRVLGFNENGKNLISKIKRINPQLNIITSTKKFIDSNSDQNLKIMFEKDILATNIYTLAYQNNSSGNLDFTKKIITISYHP